MRVQFKPLLERILISKKLFYMMVPITANFVAGFFHIDPTAKIILALDFGFGILAIGQIFLDLKFGSASDGSGPIVATPAVPDMVMQQVNESDK